MVWFIIVIVLRFRVGLYLLSGIRVGGVGNDVSGRRGWNRLAFRSWEIGVRRWAGGGNGFFG